jgi:hypothetical protein
VSGFLERRRAEKQAATSARAAIVAEIETALADNILSEHEEERLIETVERNGWTIARLWADLPQLAHSVMLAKIADGRLPELDQHQMIAKSGEIVHAEFPCKLAKEVVEREWQGGSRGVSIPLGHGVRYRAGAVRGRSVTVGSHLEIADTGVLTVTSQRAVFQGSRKTLEHAYPKLIGMQLYSDAVVLSVSNRQKPSTIWVQPPDLVVAMISAAMA